MRNATVYMRWKANRAKKIHRTFQAFLARSLSLIVLEVSNCVNVFLFYGSDKYIKKSLFFCERTNIKVCKKLNFIISQFKFLISLSLKINTLSLCAAKIKAAFARLL